MKDKFSKFQKGKFGQYGGQYVAETLMPALIELDRVYNEAKNDPEFQRQFHDILKSYVGRPSPLYLASRLTEKCGGAKIYLKREDLNHTGAHKINNTVGQALLAKRMKKKCLLAETGAGQHGVATATVAALFGFECIIYMGEEDMKRQAVNVKKMQLLGAQVIPVKTGTKTLKEAMSEALRVWTSRVDDTFYVIGSVAGPHPYPTIVRDFQSIIGKETKKQIIELEGKLPDMIIACVGGGSNAAGIFYPFIDSSVKLVGVEAAGKGLNTSYHAASINKGKIGILHGAKQYVIQDKHGQILNAYSISAGLDYPGVGPEHCYWADTGKVEYCAVTDREAIEAFKILSRLEGILPALEPAHAIAEAIKRSKKMSREQIIIVNLSGRGDKDMETVLKYLNYQ